MKLTSLFAVLCLGLAASSIPCSAADTAGTAIAPTSKIELFNGRDFTGWKFFMRTNADPTQTWTVNGGVIKCSGQPFGYMRSEKDYRDYKLTLEWRYLQRGNSGVLLHTSGEDKLWPKSLEAQGQAGNQGDFIAFEGVEFKEQKELGNRRVPKRETSAEKPVGEWNTYEIVCSGNNVSLSVNGKLMNEAHESNLTSGAICIQSEGGEFEIRKITLEPAR